VTTYDDDKYEGTSKESFAAAAAAAVKKFEEQNSPQGMTTFKVEEMYVVAEHNPIHEYKVFLRPGSP
jgi:flavin-binding protein dodecin